VVAPQDPAQEPSQDQGARTLLTALETTAALTLPVTPVGDNVAEETATSQAGQATGALSAAAEVVDEFVESDTPLAAVAETGTPTEADTQAGAVLARRATVQGQATQATSSRVTAGPAPSEHADIGGDVAADQNNSGGQNPAQTGAPVPQVSAEAVSLNIVAPSVTADTGTSQSDDAALRVPPVVQGTGSVERIGQARGAGESSVNQAEQIDRIARVMRASISRGGSRVSLQLEPRDIGPLRVQMQLRGSELVARFETQSEAARQLIEQGMQQLRQSLAAGGIQLVEASVETRAPQNQTLDGNGHGFAQQEQADAGQGGGRDREPSQRESHSDNLPWAEVATGEESLDIMA
jgi:flagellar hook-length control protein FliK